jgi:hypothetical protein
LIEDIEPGIALRRRALVVCWARARAQEAPRSGFPLNRLSQLAPIEQVIPIADSDRSSIWRILNFGR